MSQFDTLNFTRQDYVGGKSTLCTGCGHDTITNNIINAYFQSGVNPYSVAKLSGIGCSSKTPNYFLGLSHGFNSLHGRMAPLSVGVSCANRSLNLIGVSGDGDSASIGLGGFVHSLRRNVPMVYIIENNGVYGLTKGQFSATADEDATLKTGESNPFSAIDLCALALEAGCGFVARSFSGDAKQLVPLIDAAIRHKGTAVIDVISPCVTFNNHEGSTKSYNYVKDHKLVLQELGFIQPQQEITVDYEAGEVIEVKLHDDSILTLKKLENDYDFKDPLKARQVLFESQSRREILTGLIYFNEQKQSIHNHLNLSDKPLRDLSEAELRPPQEALSEILDQFS
ncbi:MAG: 2-oxoacid:ferredoxin oxidoreductase subunit beta [Bdellovibrionaceae bacterium]|nr:2-oxoacid:ferredoxin oxidoreductase subunit beta [Pseudobdellovibrionaceae bacterium]